MKNILTFTWILLLCFIAIRQEAPIDARNAPAEEFSAYRALAHLDSIASEVHFMGTPENDRVRDYIIREFDNLGIPTEIFTGYCDTDYGSYMRMAVTQNIIARIEGSGNGKALVLAGHYDSVLSSPGAADDGHAVACMLEVARLLKNSKTVNDIIFLITDGEEMGLLGAKAFTEMKTVDDIELLMNYEARGNSGAGIFFEWSEGNSELVRHLRKATKRPVSSSMAYEVYKLLPNDSDFTYFKKAGIHGINHAFIDGFSYYHNPADTPENINLNSVQHTGENMWRMSRYFSELDLESISHDRDASFFNFMGLLLIYPNSWDLVFLVLGILLSLALFIKYFKDGYRALALLKNFGALMLTLTCIIAMNFALSWILFSIYPQYDLFYTGQFYNHKWYILCSSGIALTLLTLLFRKFSDVEDTQALKLGALLIFCLLAIALYLKMPTASYLFVIPICASAIYMALEGRLQIDRHIPVRLVSVIPIAIWAPVVITLFLAFSIKLLFVPGLVVFMLGLSMFILFTECFQSSLGTYIGMLAFIIGLAGAHLSSSPSEERPQPSSLFYTYDVDSDSAFFATHDPYINSGNKQAIDDSEFQLIHTPNPISRLAKVTDLKPAYALPIIERDSLAKNRIKMIHNKDVFKTRIFIEETSPIQSLKLNGYEAIKSPDKTGPLTIDLYGMTRDSLVLDLIPGDSLVFPKIQVNSMSRGLPKNHPADAASLRTDNYTGIVTTIDFKASEGR